MNWLKNPRRKSISSLVVAGFGMMCAPLALAQGAGDSVPSRSEVAALTGSALSSLNTAAPSELRASPRLTPSHAAPWMVVLIQTALAERGCNGVAISGTWDQATEAAVAQLPSGRTEVASAVPDESLVHRIRTAPERFCWSADSGAQKSREAGARAARGAQSARGAKESQSSHSSSNRAAERKAVVSREEPAARRQARPTSEAPVKRVVEQSARPAREPVRVAVRPSASSGRPSMSIPAF